MRTSNKLVTEVERRGCALLQIAAANAVARLMHEPQACRSCFGKHGPKSLRLTHTRFITSGTMVSVLVKMELSSAWHVGDLGHVLPMGLIEPCEPYLRV